MPPNILFVFSDQHRHDVLGCAGHPVVMTPTLDGLAREGVRFSRAWCQSPVCQPSRASVITGRYAHQLGILHNTGGFDPAWPTIGKSLQAAGYETATIGKTHYHDSYQAPVRDSTSDEPLDMRSRAGFVRRFGWDHVVEEYDKYLHVAPRLRTPYTDYLAGLGLLDRYREQIRGVFRLTPSHWRGETSVLPQEHDLTSFIAGEAIDWLRRRDASRPFFLKLAFVQPHVPLIDDPDWAAYYADADIQLPDLTPPAPTNETWRRYLARLEEHSQVATMSEAFVRRGVRHYLGMVSLIDQKLGEVLAVLKALGQLDETWVVYTADHGEMLGEHRLWAKMNFYRGSVQVPLILRPPGGMKARVEDALAELTDVTATLADVAGATAPAGCRGRSLAAAVHGPIGGRELLFSRIGPFAGVRTKSRRLTMHVERGEVTECFDLANDPGELRNLADGGAVAGFDALRAALDDHLAS